MTASGGSGQQKCHQPVHILEDYLEKLHGAGEGAHNVPKLKGSDCYVVPALRHWPVWDPIKGAYEDAVNYREESLVETRESLLNLTRDEAWSLAPIRIFLDANKERGKITAAKTYTLKKLVFRGRSGLATL